MKVVLCKGRFGGTPISYEKFKNEFFVPILNKFFSEGTTIFLYNHHNPSAPVTKDVFWEACGGHISKIRNNNLNKVFIVNWGWHHATNDLYDFSGYARKVGICTSPSIKINRDDLFEGEYIVRNKDGTPISTIYSDPLGFTVIYFLWDAFHLVNEHSAKELEKEFLSMAVNNHCDIFQAKYHEVVVDDGEEKLDFVSVYDKAVEVIGGEGNIEKIVEEMINAAPVKEIVLMMNQVLNSYNMARSNRKHKKLFVDNVKVKEWLKEWAKNKWPYFVLFGHKLSIKENYTFKLEEGRDDVMIEGMISDFKRKFYKYAPIIDYFNIREILSNQIMYNHDGLNNYKPIKKGMKLTKYLSEFLEDENFDIEFSKFIQNKEMNSVIHISINPMDYMTSSITKHGWQSCHSLIDGCNGAGSLSYMFDKGTLISFLASDREYLYDFVGNGKPFKWTSKAWRQIIYGSYTENSFVFCREYPQEYNNDSVAKKVRNMLEECISNFTQTPNKWVTSKNGARNGGVYKNFKGSAHYDDVPGRETVLIKYKGHRVIEEPIVVGSHPPCIFTGKKLDYDNMDKRTIVSYEYLNG